MGVPGKNSAHLLPTPKRHAGRHGKKISPPVIQVCSSERSSREALFAGIDKRYTCARSRWAPCGVVARPSNKRGHCAAIRVKKNLRASVGLLSTCVGRGVHHLHSIPFVNINPCPAELLNGRGGRAQCFYPAPYVRCSA